MSKPAFDPGSVTSDFLDNLRTVTDPLADKTIASILASGKEKQVNQLFSILVRNHDFKPGMFSDLGSDLSGILDTYIVESGKLPEWIDWSKIQKGEKLFLLHGPEIFMLLNVSSLPMCYTCAKGAQVLYDTGRLLSKGGNIDPLARRLMETAQMIVNVLSPGGMSDKGKGIVTIQKVRLIHASIRYFLKSGQSGKEWDVKALGEPINQEDLAGTLMSFGPVILSGLKKLGIEFTEEEANAYMHCWNVVGYLLGIQENLFPDTHSQGFDLATKILVHQAAKSDQGIALTASCEQFLKYTIPGNTFDEVPAFLMDYFLSDFSASSGKLLSDFIGIRSNADKKDRIVLGLTRFLSRKLDDLDDHKVIKVIVKAFNKLLLHGIIHHFNDGKGVQFYIPPSLQENWKLAETWNTVFSTPEFFNSRIAWQRKVQTPE